MKTKAIIVVVMLVTALSGCTVLSSNLPYQRKNSIARDGGKADSATMSSENLS